MFENPFTTCTGQVSVYMKRETNKLQNKDCMKNVFTERNRRMGCYIGAV